MTQNENQERRGCNSHDGFQLPTAMTIEKIDEINSPERRNYKKINKGCKDEDLRSQNHLTLT